MARRDAVDEQQLGALVAKLDLAAKVRLLTGATAFTLHGAEEIGLDAMAFSDGPTGVRGLKFTGGEPTALLPNATLLSGAWDERAAEEVGRIVAEEAERQHIHVVLGPTINLHRTALGGRLFEAYSEDPLLTGRIAAGYVRGVQTSNVGACLKHLIANEAEIDRNTVDNHVDERTLRELYLLPFQIAVEDSNAWTIMAAYNDVNGVAATEHDEINNVLVKGEWGYDGLVMSDWFATKTVAPAANGGLDLVMPGPVGPWGDALVAAVEAGEVAESTIDDHVLRLLRLAARVGALGEFRAWPEKPVTAAGGKRREELRRLASAGMVVLKNDGDVLPLGDGPVALIGRAAVDTTTMGGGSAQVNAPYSISIDEGLRAQLGDAVTVVDGVEVRTLHVATGAPYVADPVTGEPGVRVVYSDAEGEIAAEHLAQGSTMLGFGDDLPRRPSTVTISATSGVDGPAEVGVIGIGSWTLRAGGTEHVADMTTSGHDVAESILNPPRWSTSTTVAAGEVVEAVATIDPDRMAMLGLVLRPGVRDADEVIAEAAAAASAAGTAVVVVGLTEEQESEAKDKSTLALPGRQDDLVAAVAAAARRTVVVVNASTPVLMPWLDAVDAVLVVGLPGQEGGHAVADVLTGRVEPAGRLVTTWPAADGAAPAWGTVPTDGVLEYSEGRVIGYKGHAAGLAPEPLFWFGAGLGYGRWEYGEPRVKADGDALTVTVPVTNTGSRTSREVVQVYVDPVGDDPVRLAGWTGVYVAPGQTRQAEVVCDRRALRSWDVDAHDWRPVEVGEILVARGLGDVRARVRG